MSVGPSELMVSFCSSLLVSFDELPVMLSEIGSRVVVVAGLVGWEGHGPCVASKLGEDAGGDAPLIFGSAVSILLWPDPSVLESVCDFFAGLCVWMSNVLADCNIGDFGISVQMSGDTVAHVDGDECVQSEVGYGAEHAVACGASAMKSNVSLKMLDDDTQCALKK